MDYTLKTEIGDGEVPVTIEFEYFPGTPAKLTGPMEDSYPAEAAALAIVEIYIQPFDKALDIGDMGLWPGLIEQACFDHVASIGEA